MRDRVSAQLNIVITTIIFVVVGLTPLLFAPIFTEYYEGTKLVFLVTAVFILLVLWSASWVLKGKVSLTFSPLGLPLLLLLTVVLLSTFFNNNNQISIIGNLPRVHGSTVSWVTYILFYFIAVSHLKSAGQIKNLAYTLLSSATIVAIVSLLSYFHPRDLYLPFAFAQFPNFTPTGSSYSTAALLALLLPIPVFSIVRPNRFLPVRVALVLATIFMLAIALLGRSAEENLLVLLSPAYVAVYATLLLAVITTKRESLQKTLPLLAIPIIISVFVVIISNIPLSGKAGFFKNRLDNFPREIQLGFLNSWKVSASAFRDHFFLGTGPSTYGFNFTQYKPIEFNETKYWNNRFESGFNEYLQTLGTMGILGFLAIMFFTAVVLSFGWRGLNDDNNLAVALSASSLVAIVLLAFNVSTLVLIVVLFTILAMLMGIHKSTGGKVEEVSIGIKASKSYDQNLVISDILPIVLFIPIAILTLIGLFATVKLAQADFYHRVAMNNINKPGLVTYNSLVKAVNTNLRSDLYRRDLSQTSFVMANAIAAIKGPTETSPSGSLTDEDRLDIQRLLSQSIKEGQSAATISPRNSQNWEVLGAIYRQIAPLADNALSFSLNSYGQAISLDPLNPALRLTVGGIYYSIRNYDLAIRFFDDAVKLKPDFANAYYHLSIALRDKGDLANAQATAERVVSLLQKDTGSPDYKAAVEYLADLKARIATGSAQNSNIVPPAATTSETFNNGDLPQVDVGQPEKVSTPSPIKR